MVSRAYKNLIVDLAWDAWQDSRQELESEPVLWWDENDVWDLDECVNKTPTSRHTIPLYTHPVSADVPSGMSERLDVLAKGLENLQRNSGSDAYQWGVCWCHAERRSINDF